MSIRARSWAITVASKLFGPKRCESQTASQLPAPVRTRADWERLYDYQMGPLTQCLAKHGYPPQREPESRSTWVETYLSGN